nr:Chain 6, Erythromycin resistance leader peptide [Streptococcus sanguinis]
MLVFQMRNVD